MSSWISSARLLNCWLDFLPLLCTDRQYREGKVKIVSFLHENLTAKQQKWLIRIILKGAYKTTGIGHQMSDLYALQT